MWLMELIKHSTSFIVSIIKILNSCENRKTLLKWGRPCSEHFVDVSNDILMQQSYVIVLMFPISIKKIEKDFHKKQKISLCTMLLYHEAPNFFRWPLSFRSKI